MVISRTVGGCLVVLPLLVLVACSDGEGEGDNQVPVVEAVTAEMDEDAILELDLLSHASDADGDPLELRQLKVEAGHSVELRPGGKVAVTPAANFHGVLEVQYKVTDKRATIPGKATIAVRPVNDAPVGTTKVIAAQEEAFTQFDLSGSDVDGDALTYTIVEGPAHGTLAGVPPVLGYTSADNFVGDDVIRYQVSDGKATSAVEALTLRVSNVNDAPVGPEQPVVTAEDTDVSFSLQAIDPDGDSLAFTVTEQPRHGNLSGVGKDRTYRPHPNFQGSDQLTFTASDGRFSTVVVVPITITAVDDAPTAQAVSASGIEDNDLSITLRGVDVDSSSIGYTVVTQPAHGTLSGTGPALVYTPAADYNGSDSFTYTATADGLTSAPATASISLTAVNDAPRPVNQTLTVLEDGSVTFAMSAVDPDSANLTYGNSTVPTDGYLSGLSGINRTYYPALNANGLRTFTFYVTDGQLYRYGTVTFSITPVNDAPVLTADFIAAEVNEELEIPVLANDVDADGDALAISDVTAGEHGAVEVVGDKLVYTPDDGYTGTDQLTYQVVDTAGVAVSSTVTVGVGAFPAGAPDEALPVFAAGGDAEMVSLSQDGRFVVFTSFQPLVPQDTNGNADVYLYERGRRTLRLVSTTAAGAVGNGPSSAGRLSANGRYVAFQSTSTNLVTGGSPTAQDVFRKDLTTGEIVQISVKTGGEVGNGDSSEPQLSDDGNLVVFTSRAFNLSAGDSNGVSDVFLRNVSAATTERISVSRLGGETDQASNQPVISGDGAFIAFASSASNLVEGDSNDKRDVFVYDLASHTNSRVSISTNGVEGDELSYSPTISRDGRYVAFTTGATTLGPDDPSYSPDTYVRDRVSQTTVRQYGGLAYGGALSADGRYLCARRSGNQLQLLDRFAGTSRTVYGLSELSTKPALSANGRYLAFVETSGGIVRVRANPF